MALEPEPPQRGKPVGAHVPPCSGDRIVIEGTFNFRDVGGMHVAGGGRVRTGMLYRGDSLDYVTEAGLRTLADLELATAIDLREPIERHLPEALSGARLRYQSMPIFRGRFDYREFRDLGQLYTAVIARAGDEIGSAIKQLAEPRSLPALVHCTAGKDRTGLVVGLLMSALGVPDRAVAADYAVTERYFIGELRDRALQRAVEAGLPAQRLALLAGSRPEVMLGVLDGVRRDFGSVAGYLGQHGVTPSTLASLEHSLIAVTGVQGIPDNGGQ